MPVKPLVLSIEATTDPLTRALKAGAQSLTQFSGDAQAALNDLNQRFQAMASSPADAARALEQNFKNAIRNIQTAAQQAVATGGKFDPLGGFNSATALQAAESLEKLAKAERDRSQAAAQVVATNQREEQILKTLTVSAGAAALAFEEQAVALREQAAVLAQVEAQTGAATIAQNAHGKSAGASSLAMLELTHVIRASSDAFAAGIPPMTIFTEEVGRIIEALQFFAIASGDAGGALGKFTTFMKGWGGIALLIGIPVLTQLISHMDIFNNKLEENVNKLREKAKADFEAAEAEKEFMHTADGLNDTLVKQLETLQKQLHVREKIADLDREEGQRDKGTAKYVYEAALQNLSKLKGELAEIDKMMMQPGSDEAMMGLTIRRFMKQREVDAAEGNVETAKANIQTAGLVSRGKNIAALELQGDARADPTEAKRQKLEIALGNLRSSYIHGGVSDQEYVAKYAEIKKAMDALGKATDDLTQKFLLPVKGGKVTGEFGEQRPGHKHGGLDFAVPVGTSVRAPSDAAVKFAGKKGGFGNLLILDAGGTEIYLAHLSEFKAKVGDVVKAGDIVGKSGGARGAEGAGDSTGPHLHYEVRVKGKPVDPRGSFHVDESSIEVQADKLKQQAEASAEAFKSLKDTLSGQLDQSRTSKAYRDPSQELADEVMKIDDDATKLLDRIATEAAKQHWNPEQVKELTGMASEVQKNRRSQATEESQVKWADLNEQYDEQEAQTTARVNQIKLALATTQAERLKIAKQILDDEHDANIRRIAASKKPDEIKTKERKLEDQEYNAKKRQIDVDYESPVQKYVRQLHSNVDDLGAAFENVKSHGLQSLEDGLVGLVTGTETVASAFKKMAASIISDLARIAIEKLIVGVLFPGAASGGLISRADGGIIPHFDVGGHVRGAGGSRQDNVMTMLSSGEFVVNARATMMNRGLLEAVNRGDSIAMARYASGGFVDVSNLHNPAIPSPAMISPRGVGTGTPIVIDNRGALMTQDLINSMNALMARYSQVSIIAGAEMAKNDLASDARRQLR